MTLRQRLILLFLAVTLYSSWSSYVNAAEFAVTPMMIEFEASPRAKEEFSFSIHAKSDGKVKLSVWDLQQQISGHMGFIPADEDPKRLSTWVELDRERLSLKQGDLVQVNGKLKVPRNASGSYLTAVMVEEDLDTREAKGVQVTVRYAVILNIRVDGRRSRIKTEFSDLEVVEIDGRQIIRGRFYNLSNRDYMLESKVQLRDANRRLIGQVELKTESAWQRSDAGSRVFPEAQVEVYGELKKTIPDGRYSALVRNRFGGRSQPSLRTELAIIGSSQPNTEANSAPSVLASEPVRLKLNKSGDAYSAFSVTNHFDEPIELNFPQMEHQQHSNLSSYLFLPQQIKLEPKQRTMVVIKQRFIDLEQAGPVAFQVQMNREGETEWLDLATQI